MDADQQKTTEEWLRKELRAGRKLAVNQVQWGVTVLAAVELNLYYVRRDVSKHLVDLHKLQPDQLLPIQRWILGTILLAILATIFTAYLGRTAKHHVAYRKQLLEMNPRYSGINEQVPTGGWLNRLHPLLFFVFPIFDLGVWALFYAGPQIKFTLPW